MNILLCQGEKNKNIFILNIDDQNKMYVFASKGTHATYLNLNLQLYQSV
jgi:hypothetical protein